MLDDPAVERALAGGIRDVGAAREDGDRARARVERAGVGRAVDPERHPADDPDAGGGDRARERAGDLVALGRRPARADDRDRGRAVVERAAREPREAVERVGRRGDEEDGGGVAQVEEARRVAGLVAADGGQAARGRGGPHPVRVAAPGLLGHVAGAARRQRGDEPLVGEREQLAQDPLLVARDLDRAREVGDERGPAQTGVARVEAHATASPPRSCSWR